jgi:hypothetical protein
MKKKSPPKLVFGAAGFAVTLPSAPNYRRMSHANLVREGQQMYARIQAVWHAELHLPSPDWAILESLSKQLKMFEERCPECCR